MPLPLAATTTTNCPHRTRAVLYTGENYYFIDTYFSKNRLRVELIQADASAQRCQCAFALLLRLNSIS